jgi:hypothetical protein
MKRCITLLIHALIMIALTGGADSAADSASPMPYQQALDFWENTEETWELTADRETYLRVPNPRYGQGGTDTELIWLAEWTEEETEELTAILSGLRRVGPEESARVTELQSGADHKTVTIYLNRTFARGYDMVIGANFAFAYVFYQPPESSVKYDEYAAFACAPDTLERLLAIVEARVA